MDRNEKEDELSATGRVVVARNGNLVSGTAVTIRKQGALDCRSLDIQSALQDVGWRVIEKIVIKNL